jgi:hypothetical protein
MELSMRPPAGFNHAVQWPQMFSFEAELEVELWLEKHVGEYEVNWIYGWCCVCFVHADHAIEFVLTWS